MTLLTLQTEFQARGFDYISTTSMNNYLNDAYLLDICEVEDWPFLATTTTGSAPLTITDLRSVESVVDTTQKVKLFPLDRRNITSDYDTDLTTVGSPIFYYLTTATTVSVYPANTTDTLSVRYYKFPAALSGASDVPAVTARFANLIVDAAVARAYEADDEYEAAQVASTRFQERLQQMRESLLIGQHDEPDDMVAVSNVSEDW